MTEIKNDYGLDMSKLANRLRVKAGMIKMGEPIAWGSDTAVMQEAADRIEALEKALRDIENLPYNWDGDCRALKIASRALDA